MKSSTANYILILLLAGLFSCKKEETPQVQSSAPSVPVYHISLFDHKSGEKVRGLKASLITYDWFNDFNRPGLSLSTDVNGDISFSRIGSSTYLKILNTDYVDALYALNDDVDLNSVPVHTKDGSTGPNVVNARLLRKGDNDFYFRADLYPQVPVEIHILQVSDFSDSLLLYFNSSIIGTDPLNAANDFGTYDILGSGLLLQPSRKIDTTVTVFGFGDYLNKVSWTVYANVSNSYDEWNQKIIASGSLQESVFPSTTTAKITITF